MTNAITEKVAYVKGQGQTCNHHRHWPGCEEQVPPAKWGCARHWFKLPKPLRDRIWRTFDPGQEVRGTPSPAYVAAARDAQNWIRANAEPAVQQPAALPFTPVVDGVATLIDGRRVSSASEEWRHECEARYIAGLTDEARKGYLTFVHSRRGPEAARALKDLAVRISASHRAAGVRKPQA